MREFLTLMIGKKVDIICSGAAGVRGEIVKVEDGYIEMQDEGKTCFIAMDKIAIVWEVKETEPRAGFLSNL
jgi:hypothetical protein